jgi:anti-sigma factor RsiW
MTTKEADKMSAIIARDPQLALEVEQYRRVNSSLHLGFDEILNEPIPQSLLQSIAYSSNWNLYALVATLVIGVFIGYFGKTLQTTDVQQPLAQVALSSHAVFVPEVRHAVEVGADETEHLNKWLSKRLRASVSAPDLTDFELSLVGGRLLHDAGKPAAQFMYENKTGERLTLYIRNSDQKNKQDSRLHYQLQNDFGVTYWYQNDLSYALTGAESSEFLLELAKRMQRETSHKISL